MKYRILKERPNAAFDPETMGDEERSVFWASGDPDFEGSEDDVQAHIELLQIANGGCYAAQAIE